MLDEETGEPQYTQDKFIECLEVFCGVCKASSEDDNILHEGKPLNLEDK